MADLQRKILAWWYEERAQHVLWVPVCYGVGVGFYFLFPVEPSHPLLYALLLVSLVVSGLARRYKPLYGVPTFIVMLIIAGMAFSCFRTDWVSAPILKEALPMRTITGTVEEITTKPKNTRLLLRDVEIAELAPEETPPRIAITLRSRAPETLVLGDRVQLRAGVYPPPFPAIAGGFQFNRHFYFKQVGAVGFAMGKQPLTVITSHQSEYGILERITVIRSNVSNWLRTRLGEETGSVAAALVAGEQSAIPESINENMRRAGISHVLSISGLHLALAAGILFYLVRLILVLIPGFALRHDSKKWAAVAALIGSFFYLLLAGWPVPAVRSYVMVALLLCAVLINRNVTPMRSLALAASLILIITPDALLSPSFQLSFAATIALIAWYDHWRKQEDRKSWHSWFTLHKLIAFLWGIIITSAIATLATTPYILFHFDELSTYAIIGNMITAPVISLVIMPVIVCLLILLPFGAADWLLPLLGMGIDTMLWLAEQVAVLPYSVVTLAPLGVLGVTLTSLGGLWICLWKHHARHLGWPVVIIGLLTLLVYQPPDMVVSADSKKLALRINNERVVMLSGQRKGFSQDQWLRFFQVPEFSLYRPKVDFETVSCDRVGCLYHAKGYEISLPKRREALAEDCENARLVLALKWSAYGNSLPLACKHTFVLDRYWFKRVLGASIYLEPSGELKIRTVRESLGDRPWSNFPEDYYRTTSMR